MSENAINSFGFMGREGPCFHCGIEYTPLWRSGPPEKPVLCNACGSRWRTRGTLEDYIPKHAYKDPLHNQSNKSLSNLNQTSSSPTQKLEESQFEAKSTIGNRENYGSNSAIGATLSENFNQMQNTEGAVQSFLLPNNISKKKRSILDQRVLSPTERLHQQLCYALQDQDFANESNDEEDVLIFERINHYIPENEIGLGCMLLKPPTSPAKNSELEFSSQQKSSDSAFNQECQSESSTGVISPSPKKGSPKSSLILKPESQATEDDISSMRVFGKRNI